MEPDNQEELEQEPKKGGGRGPGPGLFIPLVLIAVLAGIFFLRGAATERTEIAYSFFIEQVRAKNVVEVELGEPNTFGRFKKPPLLPEDPPPADLTTPADGTGNKDKAAKAKAKDKEAPKRAKEHFVVRVSQGIKDSEWFQQLLVDNVPVVRNQVQYDVTPWILAIGMAVVIGMSLFFFLWVRRQQNQMMGGGFLTGFGKSPAKRYEASRQAVTFKDVAGIEGVKADLMEIVEFLKNPKKFQKLGGRVPKGCLLNGPPGTGKTLLARAVAGEAGVPFFAVNGSEFIQMFVGVGASRVRDLFKNAKENSPAIIFIDEIDAVGRQRGAGLGGGHDEREQTLNQILSEMDGFAQTDFVIVLAATNRPDVLDPALLRPGRFDRHITVGRPTQKGRVEIFKVHTRDVPLADDVNLETLAAGTIGLTGADIRNIVNEAALWAARNEKTRVEMDDFEHAKDKILMGPKREEVLTGVEKEKTAYHEAGHTLLAWQLPGAHRVHKVTIVPRGRSLGSTQTLPSEDRLSISEPELRDHLAVLLAGRAAEKLIYDETTVGAENDLERATGLARRMVTSWGMSEKLGPVSYKLSDDDPFLGREMHQQRQFSEHTMETIDSEVGRILREQADRSFKTLESQRNQLEKLAEALLAKEELDEPEIAAILGKSVHTSENGKPRGKAAEDLAAAGS
jgi:cell division protease FtsH